MNLGRSEGLVQEMELGEVNADAFRVPTYISVRLKLCRTRDIAGNMRFFAVYRYLYKAADLPESGEGGTGAGEERGEGGGGKGGGKGKGKWRMCKGSKGANGDYLYLSHNL